MQAKRKRVTRASSLRFPAVVSFIVVCLLLAHPSAFAAGATIGLYSDSEGYSCSFSGNSAGVVTAYVVIKPGSSGIRGARFSAPKPSCFDATYISELTPPGIVSVGTSLDGISVSSGSCESNPFQVLTLYYMSNGGTTPCCGYTIAADPFTGTLDAVDCVYQPTTINTITSRFNADATCACGSAPPTYQPPSAPYNPLPADQATYVALDTQLRWQCSDPQGFGMMCDVYFGTNPNPPLLEANVPSSGTTVYAPGILQAETTYFWRIVVRNSAQLETSGPVWSFTSSVNSPPAVYNQSPDNGATKVSITPTLRWNGIDPESDPLTFDIYLGTSPSPPLVAAGYTGRNYTPATPLAYSTRYYWRIDAQDPTNHALSEIWSFTTRAQSAPPTAPANPVPSNGTTNMALTPTLTWTASDPDGQPLMYDVYFGAQSATPGTPTVGLYADAYGSTCSLSGNNTGLIDFWVVINPGTVPLREVSFMVSTPPCFNATYIGETFSFMNGLLGYNGNSQTGIRISSVGPPCITSPVEPLKITYMSSGATPCCGFPLQAHPEVGHIRATACTGVETAITAMTLQLNADATCPCEGIYNLPRVASNITTASYAPGTLAANTGYRWRIVARDSESLETSGPFWSFTTGTGNQPPAMPSNPSPANGATGQSLTTTLSWQCSDPEGQALTYDVYIGNNPPPLVASNVTTKSYDPGPLQVSRDYYWKIVARDSQGATTTSFLWTFRTIAGNRAPNAPTIVSPANGAADQALNTVVKWNATDPDNDALNFDVYFGTGASPPLVADHVTTKTYTPGALQVSTAYRWKIVARDVQGLETTGPVWNFTTTNTTSVPPLAPFNPMPPDGGTAGIRPLLRWQGSDPDGDPLTYTVWLTRDLPYYGDIVGSWTTTDTYFQVPQELTPRMLYGWFVAANDGHWTTYGPPWTFTVTGGELPVAFSSFDARQSGAAVELRWKLSSDEAMDSYTLYRRESAGAGSAIAQGRVDGTSGSYVDNAIYPGATYKYELVIRTAGGDEFRSQTATVSTHTLELALYQNQPNPFNPETTIRYDLPAGSTRVRLLIADANGRRVRTLVDETQSAGSRSVVWNGRDDAGNSVSSGVYFYVLDAGKERLTKKLVLLK